MKDLGLLERRETTDGARPSARHLDPEVAGRFPLLAFALLERGDLFDGGAPPPDAGPAHAAQTIAATIHWPRPGPAAAPNRSEMARQLAGNPALAARMAAAKPIRVDVVASHAEMIGLGYPRTVARHAAGMFWDHPRWPRARIALRRDHLEREEGRTLVVHEYAHAIHYLGLTADERAIIARALSRAFPHPADQDEVFAIYSEGELGAAGPRAGGFSAADRAAPGVYGRCRRQWREDHLFAAFVKKLYRPAERVRAGDRERSAALKWRAFTGG